VDENLAAEIQRFAPGLQESEPGIWQNPSTQAAISYPQDGNAFCYALEENSYWFQHRNRCLAAVMQAFPPEGLLLDVGGGNGIVTNALKQAGIDCVLLEPGSDGIRNAQQRGLSPLIQSTLEGAGIAPGSLAAIGLFDVLEHIVNDGDFLGLVNSLLQPGGRLYLTVPAFRILWSTADVDAGHHRRYTAREIRKKLEETGFQVEYQTHLFASLWLPALLLRAIPSRLGWRKGGDLASYRGEIGQLEGVKGRIIESLQSLEARWIEGLKSLPIGSSLIVAARKPGRPLE
jgi:2-polyprenyl-3-methyl-5-hydroxy-6-metoxy-1,4-benzoquinol methylase